MAYNQNNRDKAIEAIGEQARMPAPAPYLPAQKQEPAQAGNKTQNTAGAVEGVKSAKASGLSEAQIVERIALWGKLANLQNRCYNAA